MSDFKHPRLNIGDIVENGYASDSNPHKRHIYIGKGKHLCADGEIMNYGKPDSEYPSRLKIIGNALVENWRQILAERTTEEDSDD